MVKRIPCKVISTAAFSETSAGLSSSSRQQESSAVADISLNHFSISADNVKSLNIGLGIRNGFPIGEILDFYA